MGVKVAVLISGMNVIFMDNEDGMWTEPHILVIADTPGEELVPTGERRVILTPILRFSNRTQTKPAHPSMMIDAPYDCDNLSIEEVYRKRLDFILKAKGEKALER